MMNARTAVKAMIEEKIQASGLPVGYILQELGLKSEAILWKQLEAGTMTVSRIRRLCQVFRLKSEEIQVLLAA